MDIIDARVRKCINEASIIDKKMRTRNFKYEEYIVPLDDNGPFESNEFVKVLCKIGFDKIGEVIQGLKKEMDELRAPVNKLTVLSKTEKYIVKLKRNSSFKNKSILKDLIKING